MSFDPTTTRPDYARDLARSRQFLCVEDVDLIQEAVRMLTTDRLVQVLDLGAGSGTTALSVLCQRSEGINVVTVDHDRVALESTLQAITNAGFIGRWRGILAKTPDVAAVRHQLILPLDLLLVDADHEYEAVKADLTAWLPLVQPGAPVWCHDYTDEYPGCRQAIDQMVVLGWLDPIKTGGWGWLGRKAGA